MKKVYLITLLFIVIAGAGFIISLQVQQSNERETIITPQAKYETSGWQIYTDEELTFKYPPNWRIEKASGEEAGNPVTTVEVHDSDQGYPYEGGFLAPIIISHRPDTYGGDIYKRITSEMARSWIQNERILINGHKGYILQGSAMPGIVNHREVFAHGTHYSFSNGVGSSPGIVGVDRVTEFADTFETILVTVDLK